MEIVNSLAQQYAEKYTSAEDALLKEVADFTNTHHQMPQMLSGHLQGKFLEMMSCMMRPKRILEIGTFTGYSALCLAKGLVEDGVLHTIELRAEESTTAQQFFDRSSLKQKIILHTGDALQIIDELNEQWDLVFIDADKTGYINYFNKVISKVRKNGFILADNVLFHGEVLKSNVSGKNAIAIQTFNDFVNGRRDIEKLMLPLRDGICLLKKI